MPGLAAKTSLAPLLRSLSAPVPATPVTITTLPWPLSWSTMNWASCSPNLTWSVLTVSPHASSTVLSNDTTTMPRSQACWTTPLRPLVEAALMTMPSTPWEMRLEICRDCVDTSLPAL